MAQRDNLEINVDIGEDFVAQLYWTDDEGVGYPVVQPCRMDVRDSSGNLALQFTTLNTAVNVNGDFETNTTGWSGVQSTISRVTTPVYSGTGALQISASSTSTAYASMSYAGSSATGATAAMPNMPYTASAYIRSAATARTIYITLVFYTSTGTLISPATSSASITSSTTAWSLLTVTGTAPSTAAWVGVQFSVMTPTANELHYVDAVRIEPGALITSSTETLSRATITLSGVQGFIQLNAPATVTRTLAPGQYQYDLFATVTSTSAPFTTQMQKVTSGAFIAYPRQTIMES